MPQPVFARLPEALLLQRLQPPTGRTEASLSEGPAAPPGPVSMVLDTDTYNEIDDQFALVYALLSPNLSVEAIYAAPYFNSRSSGPGDGMEKSYEEILRLLDRLGRSPEGLAFRGSDRYLGDYGRPVRSEAVDDLIRRALQPRTGPLYVVAIGAITNVASALLLAPEIAERIVLVWLGGHPHYWPTANEFNLQQDLPASQLVFDCGVPLVHVPCKNVAEHVRTTLPEVERYVKGRGPIGDYLYQIYDEFVPQQYARSKVLWDITAIAYLNDPAWTPSQVAPSPVLNDDLTWSAEGLAVALPPWKLGIGPASGRTWSPAPAGRHPIRVLTDARRDEILADLFHKLDLSSLRP